MSGINLNVIGNLAVPLAGSGIGGGPTELDLVTTTGSRFVMLTTSAKFVSSSEGGYCQNVTLEWSNDPNFASGSVTSSVISCTSASLSPMTASLGWVQYINSPYSNVDYALYNSYYYLRWKETKTTGVPIPYSNVVSLQTRANTYCGSAPVSYTPNNTLAFDVDGYISGSKWYSTGGPGGLQNYLGTNLYMSSSVAVNLVKAGSPNYDAIKTNGATLTLSSSAFGGTSTSVVGVAVVQGSVRIATNQGDFFVSAVSSSVSGSVVFKNVSLQSGTNTINKLINIQYGNQQVGTEQYMFVDGAATTLIPGSAQNIGIGVNSTITTSNDCIMRVFYAGVAAAIYSPDVYHCKYGNGGVNGYVG
jgi:hypothetical protein